MRKTLFRLLLAVVLLTACASLWVQEADGTEGAARAEGSGDDVEIRPGEIKGPWDFAPPEYVVSGRDPKSFRKEGTLLSKTSLEIPRVDETDLRERKLAMYDGRRFHRAPTRAADDRCRTLATLHTSVPRSQSSSVGAFGWVGWTLLVVVVAGVLVAWGKGWFVPFSARTAEKRASKVASGRSQSRAKEKPLIELVRRR